MYVRRRWRQGRAQTTASLWRYEGVFVPAPQTPRKSTEADSRGAVKVDAGKTANRIPPRLTASHLACAISGTDIPLPPSTIVGPEATCVAPQHVRRPCQSDTSSAAPSRTQFASLF